MRGHYARLAGAALSVAVSCAVIAPTSAFGRQGETPGAGPASALVARFLAGSSGVLTSYRAFRTLEAETRGGRMRARLTAWTSLDPVSGFQYSIVEESGSGLVRQKVLRAALEAERTLKKVDEAARGALTADNYTFGAGEAADDGLTRVDIRPRRRDTMLIKGSILLTESDGDLARVEGLLVKRPSFWTREVQVVRRYARIDGVRVPVSMESTARVLITGRSTFSMSYEYEYINGVSVGRSPASAVAANATEGAPR